jgi:hypothetical protein
LRVIISGAAAVPLGANPEQSGTPRNVAERWGTLGNVFVLFLHPSPLMGEGRVRVAEIG